MNIQHCCKCGKELMEGSAKYILSIRLFADVDNSISTCDTAEKADDIEQLISCLENLGQEEIESDIHKEMAFMLCKACRNNFCQNPLNKQQGDPDGVIEYRGILH
ncbi:MAG: hypothetical protein IME96_02250 [Proteobacteria bacterium]|jgi:hypothetical protein|nr:hypothetical protein [Pseudomonadota bacterium]